MFVPPPCPINFVHGAHIHHIVKVKHDTAEPDPLACPSRSARPPNLQRPKLSRPSTISVIYKIYEGGGGYTTMEGTRSKIKNRGLTFLICGETFEYGSSR